MTRTVGLPYGQAMLVTQDPLLMLAVELHPDAGNASLL